MTLIKNHTWEAKEYSENSEVQKKAALHIIDLLHLMGTETVLDVGCGDGKITALIAKHIPNGSILGTDISQEMIDFAIQKFPSEFNPNLSFLLKNAEEIDFDKEYNIVFSSFALQWVPNIGRFFTGAYRSLKNCGRLGCTIPLGISDELEEAIDFLTNQPQWKRYFSNFELNYYLRDENQYEKLLSTYNFKPSHFEALMENWTFSSRDCFEKYTRLWLPHLSPIPQHQQETFFCQLIDKYLELTPKLANGNVSFKFGRLDFIASRT